MKKIAWIPLVGLCIGCTSLEEPSRVSGVQAPAQATAASPAAALTTLFEESDEADLRRDPFQALSRGDMRYAGEFGDYVSPAYFEAQRRSVQEELARLRKIDRADLSPTQQLAYDVFRWDKEQNFRALQPDMLRLTSVRPIDHKTGRQVFFPDLSSGRGAAPFKTVEDYENSLKRIDGFVSYLAASKAQFQQGMRTGIVQPKLVVDVVLDQFDALIAQGVEGSTFYAPVKSLPDTVSAAEQLRLTAAYRAALAERLLPALTDFRRFMSEEYRPVARETVGLSAMAGGAELYNLRIEQQTTLPLTADQVHRTGLSEVARLRGQMEAVMRRTGFVGTLPQFFEHVRTDPRLKPGSKVALTEGYYAVGKRVDERISSLFTTIPRSALTVEPVPAFREKSAAGGSYREGAADGSRPGVFFFNSYDLPSRTIEDMETLYLHEGAPGHHFQISLAQENESLPNFMRFGGNTAFVEGWAHYAETLGPELGLFTDPYQLFGHLDAQMFRAIRLVVDTGIHSKGWSKTRAVDYFLANSAMSRTEAESEIDRYIANPGQALSYKIGQLKITELRARAEAALGSRFDVRAFHEQVLNSGSLPLSVLERKIDDWIAATRA